MHANNVTVIELYNNYLHIVTFRFFNFTLQIFKTNNLSELSFQIVIEGTVGSGYQGDIAIDDVRVLSGKCKPAGYCDFENDMCGYTNTRSGDMFEWQRTAGGTLTRNTGPSVDHTTNSDKGQGHFAMSRGCDNNAF